MAAALERAAADLLKIQGETEELERERAKAGTQRAAAQTRDQEYEALLSELTSAREAALGRAASARARAEALARESEGLQSEYDSLAGRLASLNEMVATHSAFDEGVRALLARPEGIEVLGVVADSIETDETHERALEALLGDRLQAVLTSDREQAVRAIQYLRESGAGRCAFLPVATARTKAPCDLLREIARSESPALGLLSDFYRVTGPHAAEIRAALPDAIVVETLADAFELIARQGPVACVTRDGETLRGSLLEGGRSVKGLLAPRREIREAESKQAEIEQTLKAAREGVAQAASQAELAANEARELEGRIHAAEKERVGVRHDLAVVEEELARIARKAGVLTTERRQFEDERQGALARSAEIEQTLTAVEQNRAQSVDRLAELAAIVTQARSATEAAQAHLAEVRSALAALRERVTAAQAETRRLTSDREELAARIATARHRNEELVARRAELLDELAEAERALMEGLTQRDRLLGEV
ncbi:MAG: hypothetical protein MUF51_06720, partial [Vicinamibacteria bacterium]|nr:hypothetical protein [Vicinamibacteria bacterium]